jgi:hypothetical protein
MQRPKKAAESRERTVSKNASKPEEEEEEEEDQKEPKYRSYSQIKSLIRKRMAENPGIFESFNYGKKMKCVYCMRPIHPKKSNIVEHLKTVGHKDAVANITVEGKMM